jgi:hypothetical protein
MSKIRLFGTSSGYVEIAPAAAASNNTLTAPSTVGEIIAKDAAGAIGVTSVHTTNITATGIATITTAKIGAGVTISESGIEASGIGITCANINGGQIGGRRNLVINGSQIFDQRNGGSAVTPSQNTVTFITDRFMVYESTDGVVSAQQSSTAPDGFTKSLKIDCTTADTSLAAGQRLICEHGIEGNNIAHLGFGSSAAKTLTLSFYVRSNLTGTFGGVIKNSVNDRTYIFSYSISSANTWERKSITIPGDTTGTWLTTNGTGIIINWGLALGSNWTGTAGSYVTSDKHGVTGQLNLLSSTDNEWLLTGVQLEVGTQATAFEHRTYGDELSLCQRYYQNINPIWTGWIVSATQIRAGIVFPTTMRATPSCTHSSSYIQYGPGGQQSGSLQSFSDISDSGCVAILNNGGGMTTNAGSTGAISMAASAEL